MLWWMGCHDNILDVRRVASFSSDGSDDEQEEVEVGGSGNESMVMPYQPRRVWRPPAWAVDFDMDMED